MTEPISAPGLLRLTNALAEFERLPPTSKKFLPRLLELIQAFNSSDGLSPSLRGKVAYLGLEFNKINLSYSKVYDKLFNLFCAGITYNSMLLQEAQIYNLLYSFINQRVAFIVNPLFAEARKTYGLIKFGMVFGSVEEMPKELTPDPAKNRVSSLVSETRALNPDLTEEQCKTLFAMTNGIHLTDKNELTITNLNSFHLIRRNLTSDCKSIQAFAANLALIYLHKRLLFEQPTLFQISSYLIHRIKEITDAPNEIITPILHAILQTEVACKATGEDLNFEIYSPEFVAKFMELTNGDWVEENAALYGLLQRITDKCAKSMPVLFKKDLTNALLWQKRELTKKSLVWMVADILNDLLAGKKSKVFPFQAVKSDRRYPVSQDTPLLPDESAFRHFCIDLTLYNDLDSRIRARNTITHPLISDYYFPKLNLPPSEKSDATPSSPGESGSVAPTGGAGAGAGAGSGASASPSSFFEASFEGPFSELMPATSSEELAPETTSSTPLIFTIAKRVKSWQKSIAAGLAHYHYNETVPGSLPLDEMILRHRLPPQLFKLAFRPEFSFKSLWSPVGGLQQKHFDSLLYIDDMPYILEATIDQEGILYHFYARKIETNEDFVTREITAPPEDHLHLDLHDPEEPFLEIVCGAEVVYNAAGDAEISFEGHRYKLLLKLN